MIDLPGIVPYHSLFIIPDIYNAQLVNIGTPCTIMTFIENPAL